MRSGYHASALVGPARRGGRWLSPNREGACTMILSARSELRVLLGLTPLLGLTLLHAADSKYPMVNTAIAYQVDPAWPQKPSNAKWEAVSGMAVDAKDQVYVFTRSTPPVQVYDPSGKYLRGWGQDTIKSAHHIKIDHQGNVWAADIGHHTVFKFTPEGKLLLTLGTKDEPGRDRTHLNQPTDMAVTPA